MKALHIEKLTKTYKNNVQALKGISLNVEEGDFFALLGANGAGKSTTIGIITSLITKTSGKIVVFGQDLDEQPNAVKSSLGLVPQEFNCNIFERCHLILENQAGYYGIPRKIAKELSEYYLNKLGLWEKRKQSARALSGGMKRRLMIARALIHQPRMLILDEPTAGVDIEIRHSMWDFLQELNQQGTTIILTTHYLEEAEKLCRNIAIIQQGQIALNSSMRELLAKTNNETYTLELCEPLSQLPQFNSFQATLIDGDKLKVSIDKHLPLNVIFNELNKHNINVSHFASEHNRLETLFLGFLSNEKSRP